MTTKKAAAVDRWLASSESLQSQEYRGYAKTNPNFSTMIRGRIIDRCMHNWMVNKYKDIPGAVFDGTISGSG
jgi:hypothetical protein